MYVYARSRVVTGSIAAGKGRAIVAARRKTREKKVSEGKIKSYLDFRTSDTGRLAATASTAGVVLPYHSRLLHITPDLRVPIGTHYTVIVRVARDKNKAREKILVTSISCILTCRQYIIDP